MGWWKKVEDNIEKLIIIAFVIFFIILLLYLFIAVAKFIINIKNLIKDKIETKKERRQIQLVDSMLKPAEVSLKFFKKTIEEEILKYINGLYNNIIPDTKMSETLKKKVKDKVERYKDIGVNRRLLNYELETISLSQNNSSIYTVSEIIAKITYKIKVYSEHTTFKKIEDKEVSESFIFVGTNTQGWILDRIEDTKILSQSITDL